MALRLGDINSMAYALVSELSVSSYCAPISTEAFHSKRREAEAVLATLDDACRLFSELLFGHFAIERVSGGRVAEAREAADRMINVGVSLNDPRSLGYGDCHEGSDRNGER